VGASQPTSTLVPVVTNRSQRLEELGSDPDPRFSLANRWQLNERALRLDEPLGYSILPALLAGALAVMAVVALVIVIVDGVG
jgi:hypothetical protein